MAIDPKRSLDASTVDAPKRTAPRAAVPTVRVLFRPGQGIVSEPPIELRPGATIAGRSVGAAGISLQDDELCSREHATFHFDPQTGEVEIVDAGSRNGMSVAGMRTTRHKLADGDVIRMGATFLSMRLEDPRQIDVPVPSIIGVSPAARSLRVAVKRVARSDASVLLLGESGTGKEVVARAIHDASGRRGPFVALNAAAIPEALAESELFGHVAGAFTGATSDRPGLLRAAANGTLFLDEIGDMPKALQPKLLRALETREVVPVGAVTPFPFSARLISATNVDLREAVARSAFRGDLYARLDQARLSIAPLAQRREDVLLLVQHRLGKDAPSLSADLVEALLTYPFPFNVRELFSVVTELSMHPSGGRLELDPVRDRLAVDLPASSEEQHSLEASARELPTREELESLLRRHDGNVAAVARASGRSRTQVYRWIEKLGIEPERFRRPDG